jgi:hypothetical protein
VSAWREGVSKQRLRAAIFDPSPRRVIVKLSTGVVWAHRVGLKTTEIRVNDSRRRKIT